MPVEVTMPRLSDTMEQGTVVSWNVKEGDSVSAGDVLGDIETDKATMELQNFDDGTVAAILLGEGDTVEVGSLIMVLAEEGEDPAEVKKQFEGGKGSSGSASGGEKQAEDNGEKKQAAGSGSGGSTPSNGAATATANGSAETSASSGGESSGGRIFASPLARKIASEKGLDLASIDGSGPGGRIVKKDVESAAAGGGTSARSQGQATSPAPAPRAELESQRISLTNMRATIAKRLVESKQTIPHYQVTVSARMDNLLALREQLNAQLEPQGVKLSVNDFLVRACALAMHEHPFTNASWGDDGKSIQVHADVNIGVAVAIPVNPEDLSGGGLVVAVLHNADQMGLRQISAETKRLAKKSREKGLTIDEMSGATFTISNLGMFGVEHFTAIVNPPNAAILAVGAAIRKPVVGEDGGLTVGHEMSMTMSSDHRVIDGAMAAQYLQTVKGYLENPASILV